MSHHIKLSSPYCLLCRHHIIILEKTIVVLGTGSKYRGCTSSFDFPAHGHRFTYATVYFDGRRERWRLCRHPPCPTCQKSPQAFAFHIDCIRLFRRHVSNLEKGEQPFGLPSAITDILLCLWSLGLWTYPWPGVYHDTPKIHASLDTLAERIVYTESLMDFCVLVEKVARLPLELYTLVMSYSPNSVLWRFARVLTWRSELFECLWNKTTDTLLPNALDCWIRHDLPNKDHGYNRIMKRDEMQKLKFFRMGIDDLGIRSIQLLGNRSTLPDNEFPSCPWYIVEDISRLDDFNIFSNHYFIRVEPRHSQASTLTLWNTPLPPDLSLCRIVDNSESKPKRLRCVTLDDKLTGLSVFCTGGRTYGIHAHTLDYPLAVDAYWRILPYQSELVWLYFPLAAGEAIQEVWIRRRDSPGRISNPTLMARTTCGRVSTFGPYIDPEDRNYELCNLSNGYITQLIHDDNEARDPILYFGAHCQPAENSTQLRPLKQVDVLDEWVEYGEFFYSHASFEDVEQARLFLDKNRIDKNQLESECCIGILLTYSDGSQEALGQCRIGLSTTIEISHPITFHWKEINLKDNANGVDIRFSSTYSKFQTPGWNSRRMTGVIEWWFNHDTVIIDFKSSKD